MINKDGGCRDKSSTPIRSLPSFQGTSYRTGEGLEGTTKDKVEGAY
jgi:hypothetical protein